MEVTFELLTFADMRYRPKRPAQNDMPELTTGGKSDADIATPTSANTRVSKWKESEEIAQLMPPSVRASATPTPDAKAITTPAWSLIQTKKKKDGNTPTHKLVAVPRLDISAVGHVSPRIGCNHIDIRNPMTHMIRKPSGNTG